MFEPIQSQKAYVQVANQIRQYILDGKLKAGEKLPPERTLAEMFGTSRPPIREALSALEMIGLVESRTGYGTVVREVPAESIPLSGIAGESSPYEVMEARLTIEPEITRVACQRATSDDMATLRTILEKMDGAQASADYDLYNQADADYHLAIAKATHNDMLYKVGLAIYVGMREKLWQALKTSSLKVPENISRYTREHEAIYQCIVDRDANRIGPLVYDHIKSVDKDVFS